MAEEDKPQEKPTCFVVMGFGVKTDFASGRSLDLDKSYKNLIKPAVEAAGLKCVRADEIVHSGLIDVPMYEQLFGADVVVADLSTSNTNAFYELGVRHALRPFTTVIIGEEELKSPFDVNHIVIRKYRHLGQYIDYDEAMRFQGELSNAIKTVRQKKPPEQDSPVYAFIRNLTPPAIQAKVETLAAGKSFSVMDGGDGGQALDAGMVQAHSVMMQQVDDAQKAASRLANEGKLTEAKNELRRAKSLLETVRMMRMAARPAAGASAVECPEDPYIIQRLAFLTYKSKEPNEAAALSEAAALLGSLAPRNSNDTETLGLWGAVHKRTYELTRKPDALDEAVRAYERGFYLRNDYYNGINFAFMLNTRSKQATDLAEAIADYVEARRARREVLEICNAWLASNQKPIGDGAQSIALNQYQEQKYWVLATMAEAYCGLGQEPEAQARLAEAFATNPADWMKKSAEEQLAKLRILLADSPLKHINAP